MSQTILLVEDDPDSRDIYRTIFTYFGYEVLDAADGEEGIRLAREERPDAIVMDVSLPGIDGVGGDADSEGRPEDGPDPGHRAHRARCPSPGNRLSRPGATPTSPNRWSRGTPSRRSSAGPRRRRGAPHGTRTGHE